MCPFDDAKRSLPSQISVESSEMVMNEYEIRRSYRRYPRLDAQKYSKQQIIPTIIVLNSRYLLYE